MQFKAVHTVYEGARGLEASYVLDVMPDLKPKGLQGELVALELLSCMWDNAQAADAGLVQYHWLPGAPPIVPLLPRHAVADRVQRALERAVLKELVDWFQQEWGDQPDQEQAVRSRALPLTLLLLHCMHQPSWTSATLPAKFCCYFASHFRHLDVWHQALQTLAQNNIPRCPAISSRCHIALSEFTLS